MSFESRSYGGKHIMPKPKFFLEQDRSFFIAVFSWGDQNLSQKVIEQVQSYILLMREDQETTSPFEILSCLHPYGNYIRTSLMLANDALFYGENEEEYSAGVEIFLLLKNETTIYWSQFGNFNVFLNRASLPLKIIERGSDLSSELSSSLKSSFVPLPRQLLGLNSTSNFSVKEFHYQKNDQVILLNRSLIPTDLFSLSNKKRNVDEITRICSLSNKDLPFWLGFLNL